MMVGGKLIANLRLVLYVVVGLVRVLNIGMGVRMNADGIDADIFDNLSSHFFITIYVSYSSNLLQ